MGFVAIVTTADDRSVADAIAAAVVGRREAACARIFPCESVYRWKDEVCGAAEFVVEIKTTDAAAAAVEATIRRLHTYETPEIVRLPILGGAPDYLAWLTAQVAPEG